MSGIEVTHIGSANEPVVVIDGFHPDFDELRAAAGRATFARHAPHYPGLQAPADPRHLGAVGAVLERVFREPFGITLGVDLVQCAYSLVTTPEARLTPMQRRPHIDTPDPGRIALLHYLSGEETGGTAFYRHRATGLDALDGASFRTFTDALPDDPEPGPGYMRGSDAAFEMIHHIKARPNRAVLYRSRLLHSGHIPEDLPLSDDPATGRLTLNSFFQAR